MKILVVVDMQNDFITGPLGTLEARAIVPRVVQKIRGFDGNIIATYDSHSSETYAKSQEGRLLPVPHCFMGTDGWNLNDKILMALRGQGGYKEFYKPTFGSVEMAGWLADIQNQYFPEPRIESIELVGLCTDICVISNAMILKAYFPEVPITVDASCCAGVTPESHNNALRAMQMCQIQITNWEV